MDSSAEVSAFFWQRSGLIINRERRIPFSQDASGMDRWTRRVLEIRCHECAGARPHPQRHARTMYKGAQIPLQLCISCEQDPLGYRRMLTAREVGEMLLQKQLSGVFAPSLRTFKKRITLQRTTRLRRHLFSNFEVLEAMKATS